MEKDSISPAIRAKLANLPANNPNARRNKPANPRWTSRPHPIRGIITDAPHGTILDSDEHGATMSLKY